MEAMIFESHAHYDDEQFEEDRTELLNSMQENGIGTIINVGATFNPAQKWYNWHKSIHLSMRQ